MQGEAGVVVPDEGYLGKAHQLLKKHNALLIADEASRHGSLSFSVSVSSSASCASAAPTWL